ncbi:glycosyltransferase family 22 protein [Collybiopsis luxurians FD-317 M1]|uniref:Mannosyltransferase n=1 Tax=Collybiopsis luxurians FD-317 M1 TaxID=944289 RepID=A0A0D0CUN8_9AGAR|nr:glycosyltransferase family 22 protein [Collybiopsis luxurians FD-317 M1]
MLFSTITILALTVRVLIALFTRTVFQPDEYFQALEPAHHIVFGYGHLTWEWLSPQPIRSIVYPAVNVPVYWFLRVTGLDEYDILLINGPRVLHGLLAALTDIGLCVLTRRTIGERYVTAALLLSLTSFFHALSLSRSLSNSLETSLTVIALASYPWSPKFAAQTRSDIRKMLLFAALACSVRITNAVIWAFLLPNLLWRLRINPKLLRSTCIDVAFIGFTALAAIFTLDSLYYGKPTFTPLSFMMTNLSGVSLFYGNSPWHYYVSQALPILCTTSLPFVLDGIWKTIHGFGNPPLQTLLSVITWTIAIYSFAGHKEWRFIHPLLPLFHVFAAKSLVDRSSSLGMKQESNARRIPIQRGFLGLLLISLPVSGWIVLVHCSGPLSVMSFIRNIPASELEGGVVGLLMPCHSTPGHAYLHRPQLANGGIWALGCEPPLENQNLSTYRDQTTIFFDDPYRYLIDRFPPIVDPSFPISQNPASIPGQTTSNNAWSHEWPKCLILFGALLEEPGVREILVGKGYEEVWRRGRSWEGDIDERKGGVRVWKWKGK